MRWAVSGATFRAGDGASFRVALLVVLAGCVVLALGGQDGGAMLIAGYALLWFTLIRMLVRVPPTLGTRPA